MMVITHALVGGVVGLVALFISPSMLVPAVAAGAIGGVIPDLDMLLDHRRSLHFPVISGLLLVPAAGLFIMAPGVLSTVVCFGLAGLFFHSVTDIVGEGRVMRHWKHSDPRAAYDHLNGRWIRPRRLIKTGTGVDLFVAAASGMILVAVLPAVYSGLVTIVVGAAFVFTVAMRPAAAYVSEEHRSIEALIKAWLGVAG